VKMSIALTFDEGAAIVAGGSGGIGSQICRDFGKAGLNVVFTYHGNVARAQALEKEIAGFGVQCRAVKVDLTDFSTVDALFNDAANRYGNIRQVVYAAGPAFEFAKIGDIDPAEWKRVIEQDVVGAFNLVNCAIRCFQRQGAGGNLVALITAAVERIARADLMSASPKAAIETLIRGAAVEYGKEGIRANCVAPGWINAGLGKKGIEEKMTPDMVAKILNSVIPLKKFGEATDISHATLFLCSQQAGFITGQTIAVDGGAQT
jgi:3-oxoacyl-[acyl-carrier protein] reductase